MKQALVFAFAVALHRATGDVPRRRSSLGGAARAGPAPALGACVALRGGAEARALAPDRSPLGRFLAAVRAFVASFFDPAFGGAHAGGAAPEARAAAAAAAAGGRRRRGWRCAPLGAARTITVDDLKQMEGGRVTAIATEAELGRAVAAKKLSVVDFWAACGPCVSMKPKFAKLSDRFGNAANFYAVDADARGARGAQAAVPLDDEGAFERACGSS
ncbi:hypothetical protein JL722_10197 [Aureococcus anophagefferens]|nr:hypothetical protein JL722_10197 [Aureococcus anophagefferens]